MTIVAWICLIPGTIGVILSGTFLALAAFHVRSPWGYAGIFTTVIGPLSLIGFCLSALLLGYAMVVYGHWAGPGIVEETPSARLASLCMLLAIAIVVNLAHILLIVWTPFWLARFFPTP